MPRPRFDKLPEERRQVLLAAASAEFAEHGYEAASLNRVIESTGLSKGSLYYYFDDKADLYRTVLADALLRSRDYVGAMAEVADADSFWSEVQRLYRRGLHYYRLDPTAIGLARGAMTAVATGRDLGPLLEHRAFLGQWFSDFVTLGQSLNAVRTDLPADLLIGVAVHIVEAGDNWAVDRLDELDDAALEQLADDLVDLLRRAASPLQHLEEEDR